jgi:ribosomal protein S12 methylthiotransferase accessory factor
MYQGDEPVVRGSFMELQEQAVDPRELLNFSQEQYQERAKWDKLSPKHSVPMPFDPAMAITWTPAWSLTDERQRLLPLSYCYSYVPTAPPEKVCPHNPNGHAAGNTREEAILQAFLELVERDAVAIWWYNRLSLPAVELESFDDSYFIQVKRHYADLGWELWALDLTHDLGIPVCAALARSATAKGYVIGLGSHLDMRLAVQRAITEMHQVFDPSANQRPTWTEDEIERPDFLAPSGSVSARGYQDYRRPVGRSIRDDIYFCVNKARSMGLETIVLDYSRLDVSLATVKVVVPGLRHFWPRLGPGRLYQVPVKMGWLDRPLAENELNPKPFLL